MPEPNTPLWLHEMESAETTEERLAILCERILHRLGDSEQKIWSHEEVESYTELAARELPSIAKIVWDQIYLENLPAGFSATADWELAYVTFFYGVASYTMEYEADIIEEEELMYLDDINRANHTTPSEIEFLAALPATTDIPAVAQLPAGLTDIDRATYDSRTIFAANPSRAHDFNNRYEIEMGEVFAYTWRKDGPLAFRKIMVPSNIADIWEVEGSWGIVRDIDDVTDDTASGTFGIPRIIAGQHPMGSSEGWGIPRRFYRDGKNCKIEHYRQFDNTCVTASELPDQYFIYLADFVQWKCLLRNGAGQNYKLAQLYKDRWIRNVARIKDRLERQWKERLGRLGGESDHSAPGPPRPRLPWQYGSLIR